MRQVIDRGTTQVDDPARLEDVSAVGVDETTPAGDGLERCDLAPRSGPWVPGSAAWHELWDPRA
jgi:hypothetical protein